MAPSGQCVAYQIPGKDKVDWVQCTACEAWVHCICAGKDTVSGSLFMCCGSINPENSFRRVNNSSVHACMYVKNALWIVGLSQAIIFYTYTCMSYTVFKVLYTKVYCYSMHTSHIYYYSIHMHAEVGSYCTCINK